LRRGGAAGFDLPLNLLPVVAEQLTITGSIRGTLKDMEDMMRLIARAGIEPEIGVVLPMERAEAGFRACGKAGRTGRRSSLDKIGILPAQAP
jgi:D-arabinose 1-dehydrogenase-like Zn-dependent alcohol dehydrogenase